MSIQLQVINNNNNNIILLWHFVEVTGKSKVMYWLSIGSSPSYSPAKFLNRLDEQGCLSLWTIVRGCRPQAKHPQLLMLTSWCNNCIRRGAEEKKETQSLAIVVQKCQNTHMNTLGFRHLLTRQAQRSDVNSCKNYDKQYSSKKNSEYIELKNFTNLGRPIKTLFIMSVIRPTTYPSKETYFPKMHFSMYINQQDAQNSCD